MSAAVRTNITSNRNSSNGPTTAKRQGQVQKYSDRRRAIHSCDRCKKRKRACKRYNNKGEQMYDKLTPCRQCVLAGLNCSTTTIRKKRMFFSVSESSMIQLKCLSRIFKAVFPECDADSVKDRENIAKLLCVKLPEEVDEVGDHDYDEHEYEHDDHGEDSHFETEDESNDGLVDITTLNGNNPVITSMISTLKKQNPIQANNGNLDLKYNQAGDSSDKLFTALLEVQKRRSSIDASAIINPNTKQEVDLRNDNLKTCSSLILDIIPREECEFYTNYFFKRLNSNFFLLIEDKYRQTQSKFLDFVYNNCKTKNYTNEEICVFYLVWILGRKSFFSNEKEVDTLNFVSETIINSYLNAVDACLYNCFFSSDLATVKMMYLAALYHSTVKNRNASWHLMTSTCLKCISLGYNKKYIIEKFPEDEQEEVKIVWWACFRYHMNGCIILGRLPNISLYEVDVDFPKFRDCGDKLFVTTYWASVEIFKLMFPILKNREYLNESKDLWGDKNIENVLEIQKSLCNWKENLSSELNNYTHDTGTRHLIKLHLFYHHCVMSLLVPYLIAYALKPNDKNAKNSNVISSLASCINSAIELIKVVKVSSSSKDFNNLLWYDLFYAYNSLMVLLLGLRLIRNGSEDPNTKDFNVLKHVLKTNYSIDIFVLFNTINDIKEVNDAKGGEAKTVMKDASNNIKLLLKHFKIKEIQARISGDVQNTLIEPEIQRNNPHLQPLYMKSLNSPPKNTFLPQSDLRDYPPSNAINEPQFLQQTSPIMHPQSQSLLQTESEQPQQPQQPQSQQHHQEYYQQQGQQYEQHSQKQSQPHHRHHNNNQQQQQHQEQGQGQGQHLPQQLPNHFGFQRGNPHNKVFQLLAQTNIYQDSFPNTPNPNIPLSDEMFANSPFTTVLNNDYFGDVDFFNILDNINTNDRESQPISLGINDKVFWDWNKLFSEEN